MPESDDASRSETTHEHSINLPPGATTWERVGRDVLAGELDERRFDLEASFRDLGRDVEAGSTVTGKDVREARRALAEAQRILEDCVVPVVDDSEGEDVEPWQGTLGYAPRGAIDREYGRSRPTCEE